MIILFSLISFSLFAATPDWSETAKLPEAGHRENIYELAASSFAKTVEKGQIHANVYPVTVTGVLLPYEATRNVMEEDSQNPLRVWISKIAKKTLGFQSINDMYDWMGLNSYNDEDATGVFKVPYPNQELPDYPMGVTFMERHGAKGLTFSCTVCHSTKLFGKTVFGLTNKRTRANDFFEIGQKNIPKLPGPLFRIGTRASSDEMKMYRETRRSLMSVGAVSPKVIGLDTSLAQVAVSLSKRNPDAYATYSKWYQTFPRPNALSHIPADSKPGVWWNLKYKTRWLRDGSIVSGNPVFTNFLWNEIGRGTDLKKLEKWMKDNAKTIKELTAAVFATKAPLWTDFFPGSSIDLEAAKSGQKLFIKTCSKCHGTYDKAWELPNSEELSIAEQLKTIKVNYPKVTQVKNVGTDPHRWQGMKYFSDDLNRLSISKWMGTKVVPQEGYVPPPLVGIWARYPYFHNNSVPTLCDVLSPPQKRTKVFYQGPSNNQLTDFNEECVGYPTGADIPKSWLKEKAARFDTSRKGLSNSGHSKMLLNSDGTEKFSQREKLDIISFLKTL